jgi:hypothetical protein
MGWETGDPVAGHLGQFTGNITAMLLSWVRKFVLNLLEQEILC